MALRSAPLPTTSGRPTIAALDERLEHRAVGGDDADAAVLLPERKSLPLGDRDLQAVGIELEHRRIGDPRIGHQARARRVGVEEQQRRAAGDAGGGEDFLAADFLRAGSEIAAMRKPTEFAAASRASLSPVDQAGNMLAAATAP